MIFRQWSFDKKSRKWIISHYLDLKIVSKLERSLILQDFFLYSFWTIVVATTFEINGKIASKMIHAIIEKKRLLHKLLPKNRFLTAKNSIGWEEFPSTYTKTVNDKLRMCFKNSHAKLFFWPFFFLLEHGVWDPNYWS